MKIRVIENGLGGGKPLAEEKKELLKSFYAFMSKEISERYKQSFGTTESQFVDLLTQPYKKYLVEVVVRICNLQRTANLAPRFFDIFAYDILLGNRIISLEDILPLDQKTKPEALLKPVIDIFTFANRSNIVTERFKNKFENTISALIG